MSHNDATNVQVMELTAASQQQQQEQAQKLLEIAANKVTVDVPTLPQDVRTKLRELGEPVRLFGENLANVRQRLRMILARRKVLAADSEESKQQQEQQEHQDEDTLEQVTKYTRASMELIQARQAFVSYSLEKARARLQRERDLRSLKRKLRDLDHTNNDMDKDNENELVHINQQYTKACKSWKKVSLEGSQYADTRSISSIRALSLSDTPLVVSAGWTGTIKLWDASTSALQLLGQKELAHQDRIMGLDAVNSADNDSCCLVATTSIDKTAKLWTVQRNNDTSIIDDDNNNDTESSYAFSISEQAHFVGHAARLCRVAFHPMRRHVATTSFDYTWRLWDIETSQELLLQDGHYKECYGIGFHPDGSLVATTDYGSVVQLWDLRTGKSIKHFFGHAKRILNASFSNNGFQLATAGDDGTIKVWDLRKRKQFASVPAHSNVITGLRFINDDFLVSSSFDGTAKVWNSRDWTMVHQMEGHEGKVSGVDCCSGIRSLVTCGFDKTVKLWR